ncbi:response regulator [Syntrophomonas palmitatica]|uniref:response regulator n=1 Tax=Syntrophomonas palmitatica TaxID=402877 RepID=UPI0006D1BCB7|nr:response regulator [Syntrophomonas palmitatica]
MKILLVDDDELSRSSIARFLKNNGHHVIECSNGMKALNRFSQEKFHLVISDVQMPAMSGIELISQIKRSPGGQAVNTILISGYDKPELTSDIDNTICAYLRKPINIEQLLEIINRLEERLWFFL